MPYQIDTRHTPTRSVALALLATGVALLAACGGDSTSPNPPPPPPPPPDVWSTVVQRTWTLPGATEAYKCHEELVSTDKYFTGFRLASPSTAQTELYLLMRPTVGTTGDYDCGLGAIQGGEAIYLAGPGTTQLEFTGGKGVHVAAGTHLLLVTHISNTSASSVTASTNVEGRVAAAAGVTIPIDMFLVGRLDISIPADGAPHDMNGVCQSSSEMHIFADLPIMRALGTHFSFMVTDPAVHQLFVSSFDSQHVIYSSLTSDFDVPTGANLAATCTFVNNSGFVVNEGESAHDEICFHGIYRYPPKPPTSASPIECLLLYPI